MEHTIMEIKISYDTDHEGRVYNEKSSKKAMETSFLNLPKYVQEQLRAYVNSTKS